MIKYRLHNIPIAHDIRSRVERIPDPSTRRRIDICIGTNKRTGPRVLPVSVSRENGREDEAWRFIE